LLDYAWGTQPAGRRSVRRVSALTFAQRIGPQYGPPHATARPWFPVTDTAGLSDAFDGSVSMDAYGAYDATASGMAGATSLLDITRAAPGTSRLPLGGGVSWSWVTRAGEEKFLPNTRFVHDEAGRLTGLRLALCAERASGNVDPTHGTGATIYDRDAATLSAMADLSVSQAKRKGPPRNDAGRLQPDWSGRVTSGWFDVSVGSARDATAAAPRYGGFTHGANIAWVVTGGDLDNRDGSSAVNGTHAVVRVPRGERIAWGFAAASILEDTKFDFDVDTDATTLTVSPKVEPGGYWLRSTRRGYDRDWTTSTSVFVVTGGEGADPENGVTAMTTVRVVPPGTTTLVQYFRPGAPARRVVLAPGVWALTGIGNDLRVVAVSPNDTSGCAGTL
jgi:hypothetical protein